MKLESVTSEEFDRIIKLYIAKRNKDLQKIIPHWAVFENKNKILNPELKTPSEYEFINVELKILIQKAEFYGVQMNVLFTNQKLNDVRVAKILYNWDNNFFLNPPIVGICNYNLSKLSLSDGRHRTKTAYFLGVKFIPIAVQKTDLKKVQEILSTK
ncbi:hypothetical protein [uncultured Chryseobacterium sp.]|uniref:hypothetical protein n=1 Tax=uncultured Chryseobacterium sp. TaxID=259322 RepID=UPI0025FCC7C8|nr:hypothetical protein [uncultured Chryseobacterium sp.]